MALLLAPTREVAQQTAQAARRLRPLFGLRTTSIFGGVPREEQEKLLATPPHILVATPGRLVDLLDDGVVSLGGVRYVVLDEADKLLSLGFSEQLESVRRVLGIGPGHPAVPLALAPARLPPRRRPQVCLATATMPGSVEAAASKWLREPERVHLSDAGGASISRAVTQIVQVCAEHKKPRKLLRHLENIRSQHDGERNPPRVLVFANRIKTVRFVHKLLADAKLRVAMLHGERSQEERQEAMVAFRSGKTNMLVATDVAGRGLDIRGLPYVVNYDFPSNLETYVHRVGRTGRLAANGHCFSFFTRSLARLAPAVVSLLRGCGCAVDPNLLTLAEAWEEALRRDPELAQAAADAAGEADEEGSVDADEEDDQEDEVPGASAEADAKGAEEGACGWQKSGRDSEAPSTEAADDGGGGGSGARRKSLPGRLRKKLAKQRASRGRGGGR